MARISPSRLIVGLLFLATLAGYWPVREAEFIGLDDPGYVSENPRIREGLSWKGVVWALKADLVFDSPYADYWQPVTFLSRMLDIELFGLNAPMHHLENVAIHVVNTLLLFGVLRWLTGAVWRSGLVAAVFAVHPLQVEAVAWVTERKELLGGLFWMLALWAYGWYARRPGAWRYGLVTLALVLGLMSKPVGIVLPVILLLLDVWPLGRWKRGGWIRLVWEKAPWMGLAIASIWVTLRMQVEHLAGGSWGQVMGAAVVGYATYLVKAVAPTGLAIWHPPLEVLPVRLLMGSLALLLVISAVCWWQRRARSYLAVGWLWFVVGLLPVITLKDIAWAERFTYLPLLGLAFMVAWGLPGAWFEMGWRRWTSGLMVGLIVVGMVVGTWIQASYWKDSVVLFEHTLRKERGSSLVYTALGKALLPIGRLNEALECFRKAIEIEPGCADTHDNLGNALERLGRREEAIAHYREALRMVPRFAEAHSNLGFVLMEMGRLKEAIAHLDQAIRLNPELPSARCNLGQALIKSGKMDEAVANFSEALRIKPDYSEAYNCLGLALTLQGRIREAAVHFREAVRLKPEDAEARNSLANALDAQGQRDEAIMQYQEALRLKPDYAEAHHNLACLLAGQDHTAEAIAHFHAALQRDPNFLPTLNHLSWLLATAPDAKLRNGAEAVRLAERACRLTQNQEPCPLAILAAAYAEMGQFYEGVAAASRSIKLARLAKNENLAKRIQQQAVGYRQQRPCRETLLPEK